MCILTIRIVYNFLKNIGPGWSVSLLTPVPILTSLKTLMPCPLLCCPLEPFHIQILTIYLRKQKKKQKADTSQLKITELTGGK